MAQETSIANIAALAMLDALVDLLDAGAGAGYLEIYDGTKPANVDTAITSQNRLAILTLSDPAFGDAADDTPGAIATANSITGDSSADATGTASWYRAFNDDDTAIIDGTCGTSDADLILVSTSITAGQPVNVTAWTISLGETEA